MTFYCKYCDYSARDNYIFKRHQQSKKHIEKVNNYHNKYEIKLINLNKKDKNFENVKRINMKVGPKIYPNKVNHLCKICKKEFKTKAGLGRHLFYCRKRKQEDKNLEKKKFKKIIENEDNNYFCDYCFNKYKNKSNLLLHQNKCLELKYQNKILEIENKLKLKEEELIRKELENKKKESEIKLKYEKKINKILFENKNELKKKEELLKKIFDLHDNKLNSQQLIQFIQVNFMENMSTKKQINLICKDAPPLEKLDPKELPFFKNNSEKEIVDIFCHSYKNKNLHNDLSNIIVEAYRRDNVKEQSIFSTDTSRSNFYIKHRIEDVINWISDKNGDKVNVLILEPLFEYSIHIMDNFIKNDTEIFEVKDIDLINLLIEKYVNANKLTHEMRDRKMNNYVLKHLATKLTFINNNNYLLI